MWKESLDLYIEGVNLTSVETSSSDSSLMFASHSFSKVGEDGKYYLQVAFTCEADLIGEGLLNLKLFDGTQACSEFSISKSCGEGDYYSMLSLSEIGYWGGVTPLYGEGGREIHFENLMDENWEKVVIPASQETLTFRITNEATSNFDENRKGKPI